MKPSDSEFNKKAIRWGYWAGGGLCVLSLFTLALGLSPLLSSFKRNIVAASCPGTQSLDLGSPGLYLGVGLAKELSEPDQIKIDDLEYSLSDEDGEPVSTFVKIPRRQYATDRASDQLPLFQFEVSRKGRYSLASAYPYNMAGPQIQVYLIHSNMNYVRVELVVGVILFFVFGGLGLYLIRKSYKGSTPPPSQR